MKDFLNSVEVKRTKSRQANFYRDKYIFHVESIVEKILPKGLRVVIDDEMHIKVFVTALPKRDKMTNVPNVQKKMLKDKKKRKTNKKKKKKKKTNKKIRL